MSKITTRLLGYAEVANDFEALGDAFISNDAAFRVGTPDVEYGVYLEFGTSRMPAYPWARPAIEEVAKSPSSAVSRYAGGSLSDAGSADEVAQLIAEALEGAMVEQLGPGDPPEPRTGNLRDSVTVEPL